MARPTVLRREEYRRRVYGGWLGKNVGGTLGEPMEGETRRLDLEFYPDLPEEGGPLANDDLDLQLVWLHALEEYGPRLDAADLGQEWVDHVFYPWDEYGYALANLRRGVDPPVAGWFNNPFTDCMGAPIRSEIWAMVAPGAPALAAEYAFEDAIVDHAGGEGVYGEVFNAALESAAFVEEDPEALIEVGLAAIPRASRTHAAVADTLEWHRDGLPWIDARERILDAHGRDNFTDAPQNIAFTVLGLLWGETPEDAMLKAVNCGYDTDCTGATLGALLGIIGGPETFDDEWVDPVGDGIVVSDPVNGFPAPDDVGELTDRTVSVAKEVLAARDAPIAIADDRETAVDRELLDGEIDAAGVSMAAGATPTVAWDVPEGTDGGDLTVTADFGTEGPVVSRGAEKPLAFTVENRRSVPWTGEIGLVTPPGWDDAVESDVRIPPGGTVEWSTSVVPPAGRLDPTQSFDLRLRRRHDGSRWGTQSVEFALLAAAHWTVSIPGEEGTRTLAAPGNELALADHLDHLPAGAYRAETALVSPETRRRRLIVHTPETVTAALNGEVVVEDTEPSDLLPAFHRSPKGSVATVELREGRNRLELEFDERTARAGVWVVPTGLWETESPGPVYYLVDTLFEQV